MNIFFKFVFIFLFIDYKNLRQNRDFRQAVKMYRYITDLYFENTKESLIETNKLIATLEEYLNNF